MARENSALRMTTSPHEQALLLDGVAGRPAVAHNGWPNGQKTVDAETLSGNCWKLCVIIDRDAWLEHGGVFDAQGVVIRGTVELSTDETLQEEVARKVLRRYLGDEGEQYVDEMLQDGKPGKTVSSQRW